MVWIMLIFVFVAVAQTFNIMVTTFLPSQVTLSDKILKAKQASEIVFQLNDSSVPSQQLGIQVQQKQIGVQYCVKSPDQQKLSNAEFNDPQVKTFLKNQQIPVGWQDVIGPKLVDKLNEFASLQIIGQWRCKEYFIFEYDAEMSIKNTDFSLQARNQFKSYLDLKQLLLDSQEWSLILQMDQDQKVTKLVKLLGSFTDLEYKILHDANLIIKENENRPTYQVHRYVQGEGLHQEQYTKIKFQDFKLIKGCTVIVYDQLDIYSYVDKDELDKLKANYTLQTSVDIERPSSNSQQHVLISHHIVQQESDQLEYQHQYHFRYQLPSEQEYEKGYVPRYPSVFIDCLKKAPLKSSVQSEYLVIQQTFGQNFSQLQFSNTEQEQGPPLYINVPVGYAPYKYIISLITISVTLGMSLYLGKVIISETSNFN